MSDPSPDELLVLDWVALSRGQVLLEELRDLEQQAPAHFHDALASTRPGDLGTLMAALSRLAGKPIERKARGPFVMASAASWGAA